MVQVEIASRFTFTAPVNGRRAGPTESNDSMSAVYPLPLRPAVSPPLGLPSSVFHRFGRKKMVSQVEVIIRPSASACLLRGGAVAGQRKWLQAMRLPPSSICSFLFPPHAQASRVKPHSSVLESTTDVNDKWDSKPVRLWRSFLWITKPFPRIVKASAAAVTWSKLGVRAYHYQRIRGAYT